MSGKGGGSGGGGVVGRGGDGGGLEAGLGAEPGEGFVDALLEGDFGTSEHSIGFVHWGDVGAAGGRSAG
jgi:hypothetical protein